MEVEGPQKKLQGPQVGRRCFTLCTFLCFQNINQILSLFDVTINWCKTVIPNIIYFQISSIIKIWIKKIINWNKNARAQIKFEIQNRLYFCDKKIGEKSVFHSIFR
jgi:hypothetical protein